MLANTDWDRVSKIWLFDDRSIDGTLEAVREFAASAPVPAEIVSGTWDSPVDTMASFFARTTSPLVAKIDNDVILPPGWLKECVGLMARHPEVDLLGIEAGGQSSAGAAPFGAERVPDAAESIGGIGVFRSSALALVLARSDLRCDRGQGKWFGWGTWQVRNHLRAAWVKPSLQVFLLDRMPMEPWRSLSDRYCQNGWQRKAPYRYGPEWAGLWEWWLKAR